MKATKTNIYYRIYQHYRLSRSRQQGDGFEFVRARVVYTDPRNSRVEKTIGSEGWDSDGNGKYA